MQGSARENRRVEKIIIDPVWLWETTSDILDKYIQERDREAMRISKDKKRKAVLDRDMSRIMQKIQEMEETLANTARSISYLDSLGKDHEMESRLLDRTQRNLDKAKQELREVQKNVSVLPWNQEQQ